MKIIIFLLLAFTQLIAHADVRVLFLNGIDGDRQKDITSALKLKTVIESAGFGSDFLTNLNLNDNLYAWHNPGNGFFDDKVELQLQAVLSTQALVAARSTLPTATLQSGEYKAQLGRIYSEAIRNHAMPAGLPIDDAAIHVFNVVKALGDDINLNISAGHKVIIVAHSQGNFFSEAVDAYIRYEQKYVRGVISNVYNENLRFVGVASVAASTPNGRYISTNDDGALDGHYLTTAALIPFGFELLPRNASICLVNIALIPCRANLMFIDSVIHGFKEIYTSNLIDQLSGKSLVDILTGFVKMSFDELIAPRSIINTVSPSVVTLGIPTVFTVVGSNLPLTSLITVQDASCQPPVNNSSNGFSQTCTMGGTAGSKDITVKAIIGGIVLDSTHTVNVVNAPVITAITPTTATLNTSTVFTVTGTNLPLTAVLVVVSDHTCLSPVNNTATGFSQTCTPMSTGVKAITIKTAPGGTVIDNTQTVNVIPPPVGRFELVQNAVGGYYDKTECVRDNVTGLIWQGQTPSGTGLRANDARKYNYDSTTALQKYSGSGSVYVAPTQAEIDTSTNSIGFKNAVNASNLCGSSAWRLPTKTELLGLVKTSEAPLIDNAWFPNTLPAAYWTSTPDAFDGAAWYVYFFNGNAATGVRGYDFNSNSAYVRLVR